MSLLSVERPSGLLLAVANEVLASAMARGEEPARYIECLTAEELAVLVVGRAASQVSPFSPTRARRISDLLGDKRLEAEVLPLLLASRAAGTWNDLLKLETQVWIDLRVEGPPGPQLFTSGLTRFPALATKPSGGFWTTTKVPRITSVWLTGEPADWGVPSPDTRVWGPDNGSALKARSYEIGGREDWIALCRAFPEDSTDFYEPRLRTSALQWKPPFLINRFMASVGPLLSSVR